MPRVSSGNRLTLQPDGLKGRTLVGLAAVCGLAVIPVAFLLPAYSTGDTISQNADGWFFYAALGGGAALACLPLLLPQSAVRVAGWTCGGLLILSSFVTVLGIFFFPAGILLYVAAARSSHRPS